MEPLLTRSDLLIEFLESKTRTSKVGHLQLEHFQSRFWFEWPWPSVIQVNQSLDGHIALHVEVHCLKMLSAVLSQFP